MHTWHQICNSTASAYETLSDWSTHAIGRSIVLSADSLSEQARPLLDEISQIFKGFRIGQNTKAHFSRAWALQQIKKSELCFSLTSGYRA